YLARLFGLEETSADNPDYGQTPSEPAFGSSTMAARLATDSRFSQVPFRYRPAASIGGIGGQPRHKRPVIVVSSVGSRRLGLVVEALIGEQDVVIKALGPSLKNVRGFAGATELGDQRIALVVDAPALVEEAFQNTDRLRLGHFLRGSNG